MTSNPVRLTDEERQAKLKSVLVRKIVNPSATTNTNCNNNFGSRPSPPVTTTAEPLRPTPRTTNASSVVQAPSRPASNTNNIHNNTNAITTNVRSNNFSNNFTKQTITIVKPETVHQQPVPLTQSPRKIVAVAPANARETHKEQSVSSILNGSLFFNSGERMDVEKPAARQPSHAVVNNNNSNNSDNNHNPASIAPTLAPNPTTNALVNPGTNVTIIADDMTSDDEEILEKVKDGRKNGRKVKKTIAKKLILSSDSDDLEKVRRSPRKHAQKLAREDSLEELRNSVDKVMPPKKRLQEPESISVSSDDEEEQPLRGKAAKEADAQLKRKRASSLGEDDPDIFTFPSSKFKPVLPIEVPQLEKIGTAVMESPKKKSIARQYWARTEDDALIEGIELYGLGNWKVILDSYRQCFHPKRHNMSLKDRANQLKKLGVIDKAGNRTSKRDW